MKIGNIVLDSDAVLAPMAGFSDVGFRHAARLWGAGLTYTEMVSAKGLIYDSSKTKELLATTEIESPCAAQIFGSEPEVVARAVRCEALAKFDIIDINMGCPMPKIVKNGDGSALMNDIPRAAEVCRAAVENAGRPVTVKFRKGFFENQNITAEFARAMEIAGAAALTVHGRTREQYYSGIADRGAIAEAVAAVKIPVFANGDVKSARDYEELKRETGAAGVAIGRGALGNPYIFAEITGKKAKKDPEKAIEDWKNIALQARIMTEFYPERRVTNEMKKHICYYIGARKRAKAVKKAVCAATELGEMLEAARTFLLAASEDIRAEK